MADGMKAVRKLDLIVANSFADDQQFVARWKQARHVGRTGTMAPGPDPVASEPAAP